MPGFVCEERLTYGPWKALERMVARLARHAGFRDVIMVGGSGDHGADIVGTLKGQRWVFQAKYRFTGGVSADAAREAVIALGHYDADVAVAVASSFFNQDAYNYLDEAARSGINVKLWNGAYVLKYFDSLPAASKQKIEMRSYQVEAVDSIEMERQNGRRRALAVMATGLGKSLVANQVVVNELDRNSGQEVLFLAHQQDLVRQLEISSWSQLDKKYSTHLWTDGERPAYTGGVVFATWQSVFSAVSRGEDLRGRFGLIIVDEAHHAPSIAFSQLLDTLSPNFLVGLTATPWRGDERSLTDFFGPPCFSMDIVQGMQRGFLAEVDYRMLTDGINWKEIQALSRQNLTIRELNSKLLLPDRDIAMVDLICEKMGEMEKPRALVFCKSIAHADRLRPLFSAKGTRVSVIHSELSREDRFKNLSGFRNGTIDLLISIEMLNEGIDVPDVNLVAFARVTHSRRIFLQQLGRGLRLHKGKAKLVVLDFVADIRRIAAGLQMNRAAAEYAPDPEVVRFQDGRIVKFDNDNAASFFDEYLADVANLDDMDDSARLKFPGEEQF